MPNDVVGVPAITYVSSASGPALHGCRIVFVDVDPVTLLMDPADLVRKIVREGITAIVPVHLFGNTATGLEDVIRRFSLKVIEDCAHVTTSVYAESIACFSFEAKKILSCVNGGMLSTNDPGVAARTRQLRFNGLEAETYSRGPLRWDYDVLDHGVTGELDDLRASLVLHQLPVLEQQGKSGRRTSSNSKRHLPSTAFLTRPGAVFICASSGFQTARILWITWRRKGYAAASTISLYTSTGFSDQRADCPNAEREWPYLVTVPNLIDFTPTERATVWQALNRYDEDIFTYDAASAFSSSNHPS